MDKSRHLKTHDSHPDLRPAPVSRPTGLTRRRFLVQLCTAVGGSLALLSACAQPATQSSSAPGVAARASSPGATASPDAARSAPSASASVKSVDQWQQIVEAAGREGAINIYAGGADQREAFAPFEQAFPKIKANFTVGSGRDLTVRIQAERTAGKYLADVLTGTSSSALLVLKPAEVLAPLEPALVLPEVLDRSAWLDNHLWFLDDAQPYVALAFQGVVTPLLFYNTRLVDPKEFISYLDLLAPKWKGKMAGYDIRNPGPGSSTVAFVYQHPDLGPSYVQRLLNQDLTLTIDYQRQLIDWVAQGTYPIGLFLNQADVLDAIRQGLPVAMLPAEQLKEGATIGAGNGTLSLVDRGPHPNATKVFANWLLSKEGQIAWQRREQQNSLRVDISKDTVSYGVPVKGVKYIFTSTEAYARLSSGPILELVKSALDQAKH